jgi:hypothetical protein
MYRAFQVLNALDTGLGDFVVCGIDKDNVADTLIWVSD